MPAKPNRQTRRKAAKTVQAAVKKGDAVVVPTQPDGKKQIGIYEAIVQLRKQVEALQGQVMKAFSTLENLTLGYYNENQKLKEKKDG